MGEFGYIFGFLLFFTLFVGILIGCVSTYYILKHERRISDEGCNKP
jgi:hypothetical protein